MDEVNHRPDTVLQRDERRRRRTIEEAIGEP